MSSKAVKYLLTFCPVVLVILGMAFFCPTFLSRVEGWLITLCIGVLLGMVSAMVWNMLAEPEAEKSDSIGEKIDRD